MTASISFGDSNSGLQVGVNNGSINAQFHLPPERPETPPEPVFHVPYSRDLDFIDRGLLDQIHQKRSTKGTPRIALVGIGGVGRKSQLALEYCYQIREICQETWVFWVHASNTARLGQSYQDIADRAKIPGRHDPRANIPKLVMDWLQEGNKKWVLVLDNVDDKQVLYEPLQGQPEDQLRPNNQRSIIQPLLAVLRDSPNGLTVITTRSKSVALKLVDNRDILLVEPMTEPQAVALIRKKLQPNHEDAEKSREDVINLAEALEYMPLAIVQATAYINRRAPRCSVPQYLEKFQKSDRQKLKFLDYEADMGDSHRDWEAKNSITVTWQLSFDHIRQIRPSAADLLALMSFFDRQGIPERLLWRRPANDQISRANSDDENSISDSDSEGADDFEDDITTLRDYAFVSIGQSSTFQMHALVQLAMRGWLQIQGRAEEWRRRFISSLYLEFPNGAFETWAICQTLFPHVKAALSQRPGRDVSGLQLSLLEWAALFYKASHYAFGRGDLESGTSFAAASLETRKDILGWNHRSTLASASIMLNAHIFQCQWREAEMIGIQIFENLRELLGLEHPDTLASMHDLVSIHTGQEQWQEAEDLVTQLLGIRERVLGMEHDETLRTRGLASIVYQGLGRYREAEDQEARVAQAFTRKFGPADPRALWSMGRLASIYRDQHRIEEAKVINLQVLELQKKVLGPEHPQTQQTMMELALNLKIEGQHVEALELGKKLLDIRSRTFGPDHILTAVASDHVRLWEADVMVSGDQ
ncbi:kinesin [Penicillium canariense]|uniref:Kinesin n=1 Tax=Penicillium canariense TaxID=189055 RepID=A0A9W9HP89_9EURO|nr:kinesin [Penicillium canariense]KAJ5152972.1 kinesin [Penicillium canariense]